MISTLNIEKVDPAKFLEIIVCTLLAVLMIL